MGCSSRIALMILCSITFLLGAALTGSGAYLVCVANVNESAMALSIIGGCVMFTSVLGYLGAKRERVWMLLSYFYINVFLLVCLVLFSVTAVFFQESFDTWIKHNWDNPALDYLRQNSCCETYDDTIEFLKSRFIVVGAIGLTSILTLLIALFCTIRIVTIPIIMKNMLIIINIIFVIVGLALVGLGGFLTQHEDLEAGNQWIAHAFFGVGGSIFILSTIGIIGAKAKNRTLLLFYIIGVSICLTLLVGCGVCSFIFTDRLADKYEKANIGDIACTAHLKGCSNCTLENPTICPGVYQNTSGIWNDCDEHTPSTVCDYGKVVIHNPRDQGFYKIDVAYCSRCPEWDKNDVEGYVERGLQFLGLVCSLVCIFLIVGLGGAIVLRKSLAGYQTDSI